MSALAQALPTAQSTLSSFLQTLLNKPATVAFDGPAPVDPATYAADGTTAFALHGDGFIVLLEPGWVTLLSQAMLGAPMEADAPDAADLMAELAAQGFGALQTAFDGKLPKGALKPAAPGTELPAFPQPLVRVEARVTLGGQPLRGSLVLGTPPPAAAPAAPAAASSPAMAAPASPAAPVHAGPPVNVGTPHFPDLGPSNLGDGAALPLPSNFDLLVDVELEVSVELGRRRLTLADMLRLTMGSVIELEKLVGEPLEIYANGRLIAEGEAVVIDEQFGVRVTNLVSKKNRERALY